MHIVPSIAAEAVTSVKWTSVQTVFLGLSAPMLQIVKARFLAPGDFAVIAIVTIIIGLNKTIENFGISQAIIQRETLTEEETSSLFFFNLVIAFSLGCVVFLLSARIADLFSMAELDVLLKMTSALVIINGPSLLYRAHLEKAFCFKEISLVSMSVTVLQIVLTILFLHFGFGVYGVVLGQIISASASAVLIAVVAIRKELPKPSLRFRLGALAPFLRFGSFVSAKQVMTFATHHLDELIIGYYLEPEVLGIYHFAKGMLERLRQLITSSFGKVLFPVLSRVKGDADKLANAYSRISRYVSIVSFPIFVGVAVTAHIFVPLVFGQQWVESVVFFRALSLALIPLILTANISSSLLYAVGRPDVVFFIDVVTNAVYIVSLGALASQGATAVLLAYCAYVVYKTLTLQFYTSRSLASSFVGYLFSLRNALLSVLAMAVLVLLAQAFTVTVLDTPWQLVLSVVTGCLSYPAAIGLLERNAVLEMKSMILRRNAAR